MNLLDYIIIITLVILVVKGIIRGFIREISSLAGIILGIILGNSLQPQVSEFLKEYLPFSEYIPLISFAFIFLAVLILCNILGWLIHLLFKKAFLGWIDRALGACLAFIKCVILVYLVLLIMTFFIPSKTPLIAGSVLAPWVVRSYQSMTALIAPEHYQRWKEKLISKKDEITEMITERIDDIKENDK